MAKRILGVLSLLTGLLLVGFISYDMAYAIPSNFSVEGEGLEWLVALVRKYQLREHILAISLGLVLLLSGVTAFLSPRRRRIPVRVGAVGTEKAAAGASRGTESAPAEAQPEGETSSSELTCILRTRLMGTAFLNPDSTSRQELLAHSSVGDVLVCRTMKQHRQFDDAVGVFTVKGAQLGYLDAAFVRELRTRYPNHRIGVRVERITGGAGLPYACDVRIGIYRGN